ncbi:uncharacterized protein [Amphiura filiformis]|uniref:uncharacterized protein n=1 Tax=Amphiura filiformis TaxID=82378 RepID=UPI003B214A72
MNYALPHKLVLSIGSIICLTLITFDLCHSVSLDLHGDASDALSRDVSSFLDAKITEFEDALHKSFGQHQRKRRQAEVSDSEFVLTWQLESLPVIEYNGTTVIEHFYVGGDSYLIVGKSRGDDGSYEAQAVIFKYDAGLQTFLDTGLKIPTSGLSDISSHLVGNYIYIAVANQQFASNLYIGMSNIYRFDHGTPSVQFFMQLETKGVSDMEFFDYGGDAYLAVANMMTDLHAAYRVNVEIYLFLYTHFDFITSVETYGAKSIATFEADNTLYVAVAQYSDNDGHYDIGTNLYYFDTGKPALTLVQSLPSSAAVHVESMLVYGHQFLAVANYLEYSDQAYYETISTLYWWEGNQFWEYQTLSTNGPTHMEYIPVTDDMHLLAVVNSKFCTEYDQTSGDWIESSKQIQFDEAPATVAMTTIAIGEEMFLGLANSGLNYSANADVNNTNFYKFALVNESIGELVDLARPSKQCMNTINAGLDVATVDLVNLTAVVNQSLSKTLDQEITGPIIIVGNVSFETVLTIEQNITIGNDFEYEVDASLVGDINTGYETTKTLKANIEQNAVTLDGEQNIQGSKTFEEDVSVSGLTEADDITSNDGSINSILHLGGLNDTILRLTGDQVVNGAKTTFDADVTMQDDVDVSLLLNGIDMSDDIMTLGDVQTSTGYLTFDTSVTFDTADIDVDGEINELDFTNVVSTVRNHTIAGEKFIDGDIDAVSGIEIESTKTIHGVDISVFEPQVIRLSTGGIISDAVEFNGSTTFTNVTITNDLINEVDTAALIADLVFVDTNQTINGAKNFTQNMHVNGKLSVSGTTNGIDVSEYLVTKSADQTIEPDIKLENRMSVTGDVSVSGNVNDVDLSAEAILDEDNQVISGQVNFTNNVEVRSNINMETGATVSGEDISEIDDTSMKLTGPQTINGVKTFEQSVSVNGGATVEGLINNFNITVLHDDIVSLSRAQTFDLSTQVRSNITLQGAVTLSSTIDSFLLSNFTLLNSVEAIQGHKTFLDKMQINGNLNITDGNLVNSVYLPDLDSKVLRNINDQTIQAPMTFNSDIYVKGHTAVASLVSALNLTADLVTLDQPQDIYGLKTFTTDSVSIQGLLLVEKVNVTELINGDDVVDIVDRANLNGRDGDVEGIKTFNNIDVIGNLEFEGNVNEVTLQEFNTSVVKLDEAQTITGNVNEVTLQEFNTNVVKLDEAQTITGNITFSSDFHILSDMSIAGNLNGVDIGTRSPLVVLKDENGTVSGSKLLNSDLTIQGDLNVAELVNGVDIPYLDGVYLSQTVPQSLAGRKNFSRDIHIENLTLTDGSLLDTANTAFLALIDVNETFTVAMDFDNDVRVKEDITFAGLVDGVNIVELNNTGVKITGPPQMVDGIKRFDSIEMNGNITMVANALANEVDVSELHRTSVKISGNQTIDVATVFEKAVEINGNLESYDLVGPYNLRTKLADVVFFNTTEQISGNKIFTASVQTTHLDIDADLDVNVIQGTKNLRYVMDNAVTKTLEQTIEGNITFADDMVLQENLDINGQLNDIEFPENAVLVYSDQTITTAQTFDPGFEVVGVLNVDGLIDSTDVDELENITLTLTSEQTIYGNWQFLQNLAITGNISVAGQVNDLVVRDNLVTISGSQSLSGTKTFLGNLTIQADLDCGTSGELNGEDMVFFQSDMVLRDGVFEITTKKNFTSPLTVGCKTVRGLVDGVNVTELPTRVADSNVYQDSWIEALNMTVQAQCPMVTSLQSAYLGQPLVLSHWADWQSLDSHAGAFIDTQSYENGTILAMSETTDTPFHRCVQTSLYRCASESDPCWKSDDNLGSASSVKLNKFGDETFIVLTGSKASTQCSVDDGYFTFTRVMMVEDGDFNVTVESEIAVDSTMFEFEGEIYLAIANYKNSETDDLTVNSTLHKYNNVSKTFDLFQEFLTYGAKAVTFLEHDGNAWLAWANGDGTVDSVIAQWNVTEQKFQTSATSTKIETQYASDVISFVANDVASVAIANEKSVSRFGVSDCNQPVVIYSYDADAAAWNLEQSIVATCIIDLDVFAIDDIVYLVLVSSLEYVFIYQWSGMSMFTLYDTMPVESAIRAHPFVHIDDLYMAVTRPVMCPFAEESIKPVIMHAVIKGKRERALFVPIHLFILMTCTYGSHKTSNVSLC